VLVELKVRNFRKLRDRTFTFTEGLNVLRGANEEGKSTMLEAIAYAFFGVKACRQPLSEVVTWGEEEKTLRVDLSFVVEGTTYALKRSKSGAEIRWNGDQSCTGQSEVSAFIGRLFGTAPANIPNLVLSGQGDIRGALDRGPKAATELIEDLANFGIIDNVITLIGEKLLTGATGPFEEKVNRLAPELLGLEQALAQVPDTKAQEAALDTALQTAAASEQEMSRLSGEMAPLTAERDALKALLASRVGLVERHRLLDDQNRRAVMAAVALRAEEPAQPDPARVEELRGLLADADRLERARAVKAEIEAIVYAGNEWDEGMDSFNAETNRVKSRTQVIQRTLNELTSEAREKRAQRVTASACGMCGKDVSEFPEVRAKNDAIAERLAAIAAEEGGLSTELTTLVTDLRDLEAVYSEHAKIERLATKFGEELCGADKSSVPWKLSYIGPDLPDNGRSGALRLELNDLTRAETMLTIWKTKVEAAEASCARAEKALSEALVELANPEYASAEQHLPMVERQLSLVLEQYNSASRFNYVAKEEAAVLEAEVRAARAVYDAAKARVADVRLRLTEAQADLDSVTFNNALLKRVRAARPIIANKLWAKVLSAVSRYFSLMRGVESVVSKGEDGFMVNGKSIDGLSGSTKDILGLAIRLALVRTFLPHAPFLILDEPSAACDDDRTAAMMGFLVSAGFDQMLVVTHENTTEQVATSLIEI
jgi:exonuclease SbcC